MNRKHSLTAHPWRVTNISPDWKACLPLPSCCRDYVKFFQGCMRIMRCARWYYPQRRMNYSTSMLGDHSKRPSFYLRQKCFFWGADINMYKHFNATNCKKMQKGSFRMYQPKKKVHYHQYVKQTLQRWGWCPQHLGSANHPVVSMCCGKSWGVEILHRNEHFAACLKGTFESR